MLQANLTARSGLIAQQQRLEVISNNIANVSTLGFRGQRADFKDMLYTSMRNPTENSENATNNNLELGHGTLLGATTRSFIKGPVEITGETLDVMIEGDGFFTLQNDNGELAYTLDGKFFISVESTGNYLVNSEGLYVLDSDGKRINLGASLNESQLSIGLDGGIYVSQWHDEEGYFSNVKIAQLGIAKFVNRAGLEAVGSNKFVPTDASGAAQKDTASKVRSGMLEGSNVDMANEMSLLIRAQKAFAFAARVLTTADEMDGMANQLRT